MSMFVAIIARHPLTPKHVVAQYFRGVMCRRRLVVRITSDATPALPSPPLTCSTTPPALGRASESIWQRGVAAVVDDAVVSIGLFLFGVGLLVCFCVAMLIPLVFAVDYDLALVVVGLFVVPAAALFWVVIETVLSSSNVVAFCFMEVIGALRRFGVW